MLPLVATAAAPATRPTEPFRAEHVALVRELDEVAAKVGSIPTLPAARQREEMKAIVGFFKEHLEPHAGWEERVLYPAVDRRMPTGALEPFTASMRNDHKVVGRWIGELDALARPQTPDPTAFTRRADNLLGLVRAHFEAEEEVLLPILDRTMSADEFKKEILDAAENAHQ
ncbi:MAG: hemerythrin domain-containing protein [Pseudomonadota bacterium]|nr:hemerythrin domain-containing protein [Pseudomonadota bacterium]